MDNEMNKELVEALQGIQAELKRINQSLSKLSPALPGADHPSGKSNYAPAGRPSRPTRPSSASPRTTGGYSRGKEFDTPDSESVAGRFPKKKGSTRSAAGPDRPKGKGYPKKSGSTFKKSR